MNHLVAVPMIEELEAAKEKIQTYIPQAEKTQLKKLWPDLSESKAAARAIALGIRLTENGTAIQLSEDDAAGTVFYAKRLNYRSAEDFIVALVGAALEMPPSQVATFIEEADINRSANRNA